MYSINDAYIEALEEEKKKQLKEIAPLSQKTYNEVLYDFIDNGDVTESFIAKQVLDTIQEYSEYMKEDASINLRQIREIVAKITDSNAKEYIEDYIKNIAVGQLKSLDLIDNTDINKHKDTMKLTGKDLVNKYIDRFQTAINKEEMYKIIDEAYYDTGLNKNEFQKMINEDFRDIIETTYNKELGNIPGLSVYQQIIQHKF